MYKDMVMLIPEGKKGQFEIKHFELSEDFVRKEKLRAIFNGTYGEVFQLAPGKYVKLVGRGSLWMSDTDMEKRTNEGFVINAKGDVLIAGLGIGLIIAAVIDNPEVKSITVIERYQEVIDLVLPYLPGNSKLKVIAADINTWAPEPSQKFDTIYFDIWATISAGNYSEMKLLSRKFRKYLSKGGWLNSWRLHDCQQRQYEENRSKKFLARMNPIMYK
jgi:hypothetical protein